MTEQAARKPFLQVVVRAAGIAPGVGKLITAAQERDWEVGVIATPVAMNGFFDTAAVEAQTGRPILPQALNCVRAGETSIAWRTPGEPRPSPRRTPWSSRPPPSTPSQVGGRHSRHPGPGHPVRGRAARGAGHRPAVRGRRTGRPPRLPGQRRTAAGDGRALRRAVHGRAGGGRRTAAVRVGTGPGPGRTRLTAGHPRSGDGPSGAPSGRGFECDRTRTLPVETLRRQEQHRCST